MQAQYEAAIKKVREAEQELESLNRLQEEDDSSSPEPSDSEPELERDLQLSEPSSPEG